MKVMDYFAFSMNNSKKISVIIIRTIIHLIKFLYRSIAIFSDVVLL